MNSYIKRMTPIWDMLDNDIKRNCRLLLDSRQGGYLIKQCDKWSCLSGIGYLSVNFRADGWCPWERRKNAQYFSKEEAVSITKNWKGVKIVKRTNI